MSKQRWGLSPSGIWAWTIALSIFSVPALAQNPTTPATPVPTDEGYSFLRFSDDGDGEEDTDDFAPRVARQPQPADADPHGDEPSFDLAPVAAPAQPAPVATGGCAPNACDAKKCQALKKAVAGAHKPLFYENDFSYIEDPCYGDWWPGDHFKRLACGDCLTVDAGGQFRMRQHAERNMRGLGLTGRDDDFLLYRTRLFTNVQAGQNLRFYAEFLDAVSNYENFSPRPIEENRSDVLNFFIDGTLLQSGDEKLRGRIGRQELLYGSQRLISPLDWSDTRRTFDGGKLMWQNSDWNVDGFWVRPTTPDPVAFNKTNLNEQFYGVTSTYHGRENELTDIYWLTYENDLAPFRYDTIGARQTTAYGCWLTEIEGGYQFGDNQDGSDHNAGFVTAGVGRKLNYAWSPTLWLYYDWASGTSDLASGNGFNHLFPLGHKYLGFMDLYGRSNIETPNVQLTLQPTERLTLLMWYYYFFLENKNDGPYSVVMTPFSNVAPGSADLGHEVDMTASYAVNARTNLLLGYSHFFAGDYYATPGLPYDGDADFFYTQLTFNF